MTDPLFGIGVAALACDSSPGLRLSFSHRRYRHAHGACRPVRAAVGALRRRRTRCQLTRTHSPAGVPVPELAAPDCPPSSRVHSPAPCRPYGVGDRDWRHRLGAAHGSRHAARPAARPDQ